MDGHVNSYFGFSISRGLDIDENGYNDIAVSAPNIDSIYIYKTYPSIKIISSISPLSRSKISMNTTSTIILTCISYKSTNIDLNFDIEMSFKITLDPVVNRGKFTNGSNEKNFNTTITSTVECSQHEIEIEFNLREIGTAIELILEHQSPSKFETVEVFCEKCALLNPSDRKIEKGEIWFDNQCENKECLVDLRITGRVLEIL